MQGLRNFNRRRAWLSIRVSWCACGRAGAACAERVIMTIVKIPKHEVAPTSERRKDDRSSKKLITSRDQSTIFDRRGGKKVPPILRSRSFVSQIDPFDRRVHNFVSTGELLASLPVPRRGSNSRCTVNMFLHIEQNI